MQLLYCCFTDFCYGKDLAISQCSDSTELCTKHLLHWFQNGHMSKFPAIGSTKKYIFKEFNCPCRLDDTMQWLVV